MLRKTRKNTYPRPEERAFSQPGAATSGRCGPHTVYSKPAPSGPQPARLAAQKVAVVGLRTPPAGRWVLAQYRPCDLNATSGAGGQVIYSLPRPASGLRAARRRPTSRQVQRAPTFVEVSANADQTRSGPPVTSKPDVSVVIPM